MHPLIRLWLKAKRARWRDDHGRLERRRKLVQDLAPGRSFVDIGGMWSLAGQIAFWAEEAGATNVTLVDAFDPSDEFLAEHTRRNSKVTYIQADLHEPASIELKARMTLSGAPAFSTTRRTRFFRSSTCGGLPERSLCSVPM